MNSVLFWKEYRQQRPLWLAIFILAILLGEGLLVVLGRGTEAQAAPAVALFCLALTYGVVSGASLLATEKEDGTLAFLDTLTSRRSALWRSKVLAGFVLTVVQGLALAGLGLSLGFCSWESAMWLPVMGLDAFVWGLLGGALGGTAVTAVLAGILLLAGSWGLAVAFANSLAMFFIQGGLTGLAAVGSWRIFCGPDLARRAHQAGVQGRARRTYLTPGRVIFWLALRQGRWVLLSGGIVALLLGLAVNYEPVLLWPLGTLVLGLIFGLAVFVPDQKAGVAFFSTLRVPPTRIWLWKIGLWAAALSAMVAVAWYIGTGVVWSLSLPLHTRISSNEAIDHFGEVGFWINQWFVPRGSPFDHEPRALLWLGPLTGFCVGQFFGLVARRSLHAVVLATFLAVPLAVLWVPSVFIGGISFWQPLFPAIVLLVGSWLTMRPWMAGRLGRVRPMLVVTGTFLLAIAWLVGSLWYRALEVPNVGEPFDEQAFIASYPPPEKNEAGRLLRQAAESLGSLHKELTAQFGQPKETAFPPEENSENSILAYEPGYDGLLQRIVEQGWPPNSREATRWLDALFAGEWTAEARQAVRMPLGVVMGPNEVRSPRSWQLLERLRLMARLLVARALQRQAHGDSRGALDELETALRLARQVENRGSMHQVQFAVEINQLALRGLYHWLMKAGSDRALLRDALALVRRQAAEHPDLADAVKMQFLLAPQPLPQLVYQAPWERERQVRIQNAICAGVLRIVARPPGLDRPLPPRGLDPADLVAWADLPPPEGPGSTLSARQWGQFLLEDLTQFWTMGYSLRWTTQGNQRRLSLAEVGLAVCLYQADHGHAPPALDALVPTYLTAVPVDPKDGKPFNYRVSQGEEIGVSQGPGIKVPGERPIKLSPGQAILDSGYVLPAPKK